MQRLKAREIAEQHRVRMKLNQRTPKELTDSEWRMQTDAFGVFINDPEAEKRRQQEAAAAFEEQKKLEEKNKRAAARRVRAHRRKKRQARLEE